MNWYKKIANPIVDAPIRGSYFDMLPENNTDPTKKHYMWWIDENWIFQYKEPDFHEIHDDFLDVDSQIATGRCEISDDNSDNACFIKMNYKFSKDPHRQNAYLNKVENILDKHFLNPKIEVSL